MNRFVTGALALAATSTFGFAEPADDSDWLELDSEINGLASSYAASQEGMGWTALLRFTYTFSSDDIATGDGGDDISGFKFEDVDMAFWGGVGNYQWRISWDMGNAFTTFDGSFELEDAYVMWECDEYFTTTAGNYKMRVLMSDAVDPEHQLFIDRTALGSAFDAWEPGVAVNGSQEVFHWYAGLQNSSDGQESGHRYYARAEFDLGTGAGAYEGALGANDDLNATIGGVFYNDDDVSGDGAMWAVDGRGTVGPFGFGGEIAFVEEDLTSMLSTGSDFSRLFDSSLSFADDDDTTPFGAWVSFLLNDEFEAGARYDDLDNGDDESVISVVLNWYRSGHNAKWQAQWSNIDSDEEDGNIFQVGVVVGSTR
jgi:hypothetical protein